jgi:hypothetical protein
MNHIAIYLQGVALGIFTIALGNNMRQTAEVSEAGIFIMILGVVATASPIALMILTRKEPTELERLDDINKRLEKIATNTKIPKN